jgi:hypothetical protein
MGKQTVPTDSAAVERLKKLKGLSAVAQLHLLSRSSKLPLGRQRQGLCLALQGFLLL